MPQWALFASRLCYLLWEALLRVHLAMHVSGEFSRGLVVSGAAACIRLL